MKVKVLIAALRAAGVSADDILRVIEEASREEDTDRRDKATARQQRWRDNKKSASIGSVDAGRRLQASTQPKDKKKKKKQPATGWPGFEGPPPEWIEQTPFRSPRELEYAFDRFRNWALQRGATFVSWTAAWRNCAGRTGWAFRTNGGGATGATTGRRDAFAAAVDALRQAGVSQAGEPPDGPVHRGGGLGPTGVPDGDRFGDDALPDRRH